MFEALLSFIDQAPPLLVFLVIFIASYIENIFPPVPGDTILIFGAYLVGRGNLSFSMALMTTLAGSVTGFMTLYLLGLKYGRGYIYSKQQNWFSPKSLKRVERMFVRWGYGVVFFNRFLAGLRSVVALFAGVSRLNHVKVVFLAGLSSLIWNGGLLLVGSTIGENWEQIQHHLKQYNTAVTVILLSMIVGFLVHRYIVIKKNREMRN